MKKFENMAMNVEEMEMINGGSISLLEIMQQIQNIDFGPNNAPIMPDKLDLNNIEIIIPPNWNPIIAGITG